MVVRASGNAVVSMVVRGRLLTGRELRVGPFIVALRCGSTRTRFACLPSTSPHDLLSDSDAVKGGDSGGWWARCSWNQSMLSRSSRGSRRWMSATLRLCAACGCQRRGGGERRVQEVCRCLGQWNQGGYVKRLSDIKASAKSRGLIRYRNSWIRGGGALRVRSIAGE